MPSRLKRYVRRYRSRTPRKYARRRYRKARTTTRRRRYPKGRVSRRRIINIASTKKRDTLINLTNTSTSGADLTSIAVGRATLLGNTTPTFLWCPTSREPDTEQTGNPTTLSTGNPYFVGLKENLRIDTNSGRPWRHRRICFTTKQEVPFQQEVDRATGVDWEPNVRDVTVGYVRPWINLATSADYNTLTGLIRNIIFRGSIGSDYDNPMDAVVDRDRVTIKFDKTWVIRPQTSQGATTPRRLYHPMNSNFYYDQDEQGEKENYSAFHAATRKGMGDYYVLDLFDCFGGTSSDALSIGGDSVLYWHER